MALLQRNITTAYVLAFNSTEKLALVAALRYAISNTKASACNRDTQIEMLEQLTGSGSHGMD